MSEYDDVAKEVVRLGDAIWSAQFSSDVNNWDSAMRAAGVVYAAQVQAAAIEALSDAVFEKLDGIQGTLYLAITGEEL